MSEIEFLEWRRPRLTDATYEIALEQNVDTGKHKAKYTARSRFKVGGDLHPLKPDDLHAVFPAAGSIGDHALVVPHVGLVDPTLPWARSADGGEAPWLALLLVREDDSGDPPVYETITPAQGAPRLETVILPNDLLTAVAPRLSDLAYLAHVRLNTQARREVAVVLSPRLPSPASRNTCLLVSIEGRYDEGETIRADPGGTTRLVVLHRWSFSCLDAEKTFLGLMNKAKASAAPLRLPAPDGLDAGAEATLASGAVPIRHRLRNGGSSVAWYRGPFVAGEALPSRTPAPDPWAALSADALYRFDPATGVFSIGYAAAWEIGRLTALASKAFARSVTAGRRGAARAAYAKLQEGDHPAMRRLARATGKTPSGGAAGDGLDAESATARSLAALRDVPFAYLVPDEAQLPPDSLRHFAVDPDWIEALLAGAFSVGRSLASDPRHEGDARKLAAGVARPAAGVLLRSEAISGWPGLIVDGFDRAGEAVEVFNRERLAPDVILVLFAKPVGRIDLHLPPENLHHGFEPRDGDRVRTLRRLGGDYTEGVVGLANVEGEPGVWVDEDRGVFSARALAGRMLKALPPDERPAEADAKGSFFGFQMVEGTGVASVLIERATH